MKLHEEYTQLVRKLLKYDQEYHVDGTPSVSDARYDFLIRKLRKIEEKHPDWIVPESPTQRVGYLHSE